MKKNPDKVTYVRLAYPTPGINCGVSCPIMEFPEDYDPSGKWQMLSAKFGELLEAAVKIGLVPAKVIFLRDTESDQEFCPTCMHSKPTVEEECFTCRSWRRIGMDPSPKNLSDVIKRVRP